MTPILLDIGCIVALLDASEEHHAACAGVLAVLENVERDVFHIPLRLDECAASVARLMRRYRDVPMSFADAFLVHLGEALRTGRILTLDSNFRIYRWGRNRPFELLVDL